MTNMEKDHFRNGKDKKYYSSKLAQSCRISKRTWNLEVENMHLKCDPTAAITWKHKTEVQNGGQALRRRNATWVLDLMIKEASTSHAKCKTWTRQRGLLMPFTSPSVLYVPFHFSKKKKKPHGNYDFKD